MLLCSRIPRIPKRYHELGFCARGGQARGSRARIAPYLWKPTYFPRQNQARIRSLTGLSISSTALQIGRPGASFIPSLHPETPAQIGGLELKSSVTEGVDITIEAEAMTGAINMLKMFFAEVRGELTDKDD